MRLSGWQRVGAAALLATVACGKDDASTPHAPSGSGGSAGAAAGSGQGGSSVAAGGSGATSSAGTSTGGGDAVGNGELDATCRERTTNHIGGSEIGLRETVTAEGDRAFQAFYDKKTGEDCELIEDAEGTTRCFPLAGSVDPTRFYLDEGCTQGVEYRGICGRDHFVVAASEDSCDTRRRVFGYGPAVASSMVWERRAGGECQAYGQLSSLYERGAELLPSDYPAVTPVTWRGADRIEREGFEGAGGLRIVRAFRDSELLEPCTVTTLADGKPYCAPYQLGSLAFTDQACSEVLFSRRSLCGGAAPKFAAARSSQSCLGDTYVEADAPYSGAVYKRSGCMPATAAETEGLSVSTLKTVAPERFVATEAVVNQQDSGRLKPVYNETSGGGCWFEGWFDSEQSTRCSFMLASDDRYRCLPVPPPGQVLKAFSDPLCSEPISFYSASCSAAEVPKLVTTELKPACHSSSFEVRPVLELAEAAALPPLWTKQVGGCQSYTPLSALHELGEPLPPESFLAAELEP